MHETGFHNLDIFGPINISLPTCSFDFEVPEGWADYAAIYTS